MTYPITAKLNGNTCKFTWKDSWNNQGTGVLTLKSKAVTITMTQTTTAPGNRGSLAKKNFTIKWRNGSTGLTYV
ncbi:MAG: hypothetical protein Q4D16_05275 [Eubacteriales bacterium]|nr:hypothetical protein [Eubacteriales bacterium]